MKAIVLSSALIGFVFASAEAADESPRPGGWRIDSYTAPSLYRFGLDREIRHGGKSAGFLESHDADFAKNHYARLEQSIDAATHRGKRLRLSAFLKTKDVKKSAGLDVVIPHKYSDSEDRFSLKPALEGSTDWKRYEVEFTVNHYATQVDFCVKLYGAGRIWIDDVALDVIGDANLAPPTNTAAVPKAESLPALFDGLTNADFEQTQIEYHQSVMQGLWEIRVPAVEGKKSVTRHTKLVQGNKITTTDYYDGGEIWQQFTQTFDLERSGRISLITLRGMESTLGMAKGSRAPPGAFQSIPYTVNRSQFVEILQVIDGDKGPPVLMQWNRVAK